MLLTVIVTTMAQLKASVRIATIVITRGHAGERRGHWSDEGSWSLGGERGRWARPLEPTKLVEP